MNDSKLPAPATSPASAGSAAFTRIIELCEEHQNADIEGKESEAIMDDSDRMIACILGVAIDALAKQEQVFAALKDANDLCRSAYQVAIREGRETNWPSFRDRLSESLAHQHRVMYPPNAAMSDCAGGKLKS